MTKILALDQSSRITGWAVFEDDKLIDSGKFTVSDDDIGIRLVKIRKKVLELISQFEIDKVYFEDIQLQGNVTNNVQTFKVLAEVFGVIYETLKDACEFIVKSIKKTIEDKSHFYGVKFEDVLKENN